ncbi:MAG: ceramidase domain-containing protein [Proteobacteria bacterium]|nr:ceramidase domain-containing protein [Pseudomonadota bacterium]
MIGAMLVAPIPQDLGYHAFADTRSGLGIPNFGDTVSNLGFAVVGIWGLWLVLGRVGKDIFSDRADAWPYIVFFIGIAFVSLGSAYYHLAPDNDRLFWDRLPMTIGFMAIFSALVADRIHQPIATRLLLPLLVLAGLLCLLYWNWTEARGHGDLRFYGLVQLYPMVALPLILWLFPRAHYTAGNYLFWVIFWYALAKVLEVFDREIFSLLGHAVSGHSLKHLAAAVATFVVVRMIAVRHGAPMTTK